MRFLPNKRTVKRAAIALAILISLLLIANATMAWRTESALQRRFDAIRAAGDPAILADLAPQPIPDEENAAAYLEKLTPLLKKFSQEYGRFYKTPLGKAYDVARERGEPPTAEQAAAMRAILDKYAAIDDGLAEAASCEQFASRGDFSARRNAFLEETLDRVQEFRTAARFLAWQSQALLQAGDIDAAAERGLTMLRLARLHEGEPLMVSHLVSNAVQGVAIAELDDVLSAGAVSPELRAAIDEELARQDDPHQFARVVRKERAFALNSLDRLPNQSVSPMLFNTLSWPMKRMYFGVLDHYEEILAAADGPLDEFRRQMEPGGALAPPTGHGVLADLLTPSLEAAASAEDQSTALLRSLRVFNALQQYAAEQGSEASGIADLDLPAEATIDPFSGKPLIVKRVGDDWLVYSVGRDGVDDGGELASVKDVGVGPVTLPSENADTDESGE